MTKPACVRDLEAAYGPPSQQAFGSAVFYEELGSGAQLEQSALATYRFFVGDLWERFGEEAWMGPWKKVHARTGGGSHDIVAELRAIGDPAASQSVPMLLDAIDGPDRARAALVAAYDDPAATELAVYTIGDGEAMSGLLIAGFRPESGEATFLVFLMD